VKRYRAAGLTIDVEKSIFAMISRMNRMNPAPGSKNLDYFKGAYRHYKTYILVPGVLSSDDSSVKLIPELGIFKSTIHFRQASDIDPKQDPTHRFSKWAPPNVLSPHTDNDRPRTENEEVSIRDAGEGTRKRRTRRRNEPPHAWRAGGPLKPGFGLSGDVHTTDLGQRTS